MRITFISPTVNLGGGTKVIAIYAKALMRMGHIVCLVSPPPQPISFRRRLKSVLMGNGWPSNQARPPSHLDGSAIDHRVLNRWRSVLDGDVPDADVVVATWWETAEWVNALSPEKGAKVYFIQGHEVFSHLPVARSQATYRFQMHKIVIAEWLREVMSTQYGDHVVDVVPNSVDRSQFFAETRGKHAVPTVGFLYSTVPVKGLDISLAVIELVRRRTPSLRVMSFGSEHPSVALPLPKHACFFFRPAQHEIRNLYSQCDVWISTSRSEGFNLPAMEAMACRTPVVATRTGWPEEAVQAGKNGFLVDVDDIDALARGMESVLSLSDREWRNMSSNALETVASGSWQQSAEKFELALKHACRRSARGEIAGQCSERTYNALGVSVQHT